MRGMPTQREAAEDFSAGADAQKNNAHGLARDPSHTTRLATTDAYFFDELQSNLGRKDAQRWLLEQTRKKSNFSSLNTRSALLAVFPQLEENGLIRSFASRTTSANSSFRRERSGSLVKDFPQLTEFGLSPASQSPPSTVVQSSQASASTARFRKRSQSSIFLDFPQLEEFGFSQRAEASIIQTGRKPGYCAAHSPSEGPMSSTTSPGLAELRDAHVQSPGSLRGERSDYGLLYTDAAHKVIDAPPCGPIMTGK